MPRKYSIDSEKCTACGGCAALCPVNAIEVTAKFASINDSCIGCGACDDFCPISVISEVK